MEFTMIVLVSLFISSVGMTIFKLICKATLSWWWVFSPIILAVVVIVALIVIIVFAYSGDTI